MGRTLDRLRGLSANDDKNSVEQIDALVKKLLDVKSEMQSGSLTAETPPKLSLDIEELLRRIEALEAKK